MICAAVPWRWSGIVGTMMTFGDFDARVVFFFGVQSLPRVIHQTGRCNLYLE